MLQLGHDFLFEVSKDYHFTTRFVVSTKLPDAKMQEDVYASFDVETDLIKNFSGLDGSIMDKPIMILRYIPEEDAFDFDRAYLEAVQSRVDKLMDESERLDRKGGSPIIKPIPRNARKAKAKTPEIKPPKEIVEEEKMMSSTSHQSEAEEEREFVKDISSETDKVEEQPNESYEMRMRRERLQREKQKRANLALKRGYESSLIRQVAEENRKMSSAEVQQKTKEKQDSSLIEKAEVEKQIKADRRQQKEAQLAKELETSENKQIKTQMEAGMIREVAASNRQLGASNSKKSQLAVDDPQTYRIEPKIRENRRKDNFKTLEDLWLDYPSYTVQFSKETYGFGMVNYYIDKQAVEKAEFCQKLSDLKAYKIQLKCE